MRRGPSERRKLERIDLRLLACLEALVSERSVTRAAERLEMSQPGMSNALARLRKLVRDPLLVSTARGMVPTPRAIDIAQSVRQGMRHFEVALFDNGPFVPRAASATVTIAAADYAGLRLFPHILRRVNEEAPGVSLVLRPPDPKHVREWLEEGTCDLLIGYFPALPPKLRVSMLLEEPLVCVARKGHPAIKKRMTLQKYADAGHVIFGSPFSPVSTLDLAIDDTLARLGIQRRIVMRVASVLLPSYMVAETDFIATLARGLAEHHAAVLPIEVHPLPFAIARISMSIVWHDRTHQNGLHQWMRQVVREVSLQDRRGVE